MLIAMYGKDSVGTCTIDNDRVSYQMFIIMLSHNLICPFLLQLLYH